MTPTNPRIASTVPAASAAGPTAAGPTQSVQPVSALADLLTRSQEGQTEETTTQGQPGEAGQPAPELEGAGAATELQPSSESGAETTGEPGAEQTGVEATETLSESPGEEPGGELPAGADETTGEPAAETPSQAAEKRIKRLVGQVHDLEARLEQAQRTQPAPVGPGPLDSVSDPVELDQREERATAGLQEAEDVLDMVRDDPNQAEQYLRGIGLVLRDQNGNEDFSPANIRQVMSQAKYGFRQTLRAIPRRRGYLQEYAKAHAQVVKAIPWTADRSDERYAFMQNIASEFPGLKTKPNWEYWTACAIEGHQAVQTRLKRTAAPAGAARTNGAPVVNGRPAARGAGGPPGGAPRVRPSEAKVNAARQRVLKEGSRAALSEFFQQTGFVR